MAVALVFICVPIAFGLAMTRSVPAPVAWIVPVALGGFWYAA